MPLTAFKLLLRPGQAIPELGAGSSPAAQMIVTAILSSLWPAAAVVAGNVLAGFAGHEEPDVAVRRAVVGLLCAVGSACVSAPALALAILRVTRDYGEHIDAKRACGAAVRLVAPMWACGVVAALPPLVGLGPEAGELLWMALAVPVGVLAIRGAVSQGLEVRRRWRLSFVVVLSLVAGLMIPATLILPAAGLRWLLGAATPIPLPALEPGLLPFPPPPSW